MLVVGLQVGCKVSVSSRPPNVDQGAQLVLRSPVARRDDQQLLRPVSRKPSRRKLALSSCLGEEVKCLENCLSLGSMSSVLMCAAYIRLRCFLFIYVDSA
jgi:hypothetical protein